jgi:predicted metalloendopeptidase
MNKSKKNKVEKNNNKKEHRKTIKNMKSLYSFVLPLKGKNIVKTYDKELEKKTKKKSKCANLLITPYEKDFTMKHLDILIKGNNNTIKNELTKFFSQKNIPKKITPESDYYTYINYRWLEQQSLITGKTKTYYFKIDSFRVTQDKIYGEIAELIQEYIKNHSKEYKVKQLSNYYNSLLNINNFNPSENIKEIIKEINLYIGNGDLTLFLSYINSNELISYKCPIVWSIEPDMDNASVYTCNINIPMLTLDFSSYFITGDLNKDETFVKYMKYLNDIFEICMGKNHGMDVSNIYLCEKEIINAIICEKVKRFDKNNNKSDRVSINQSLQYGFDWENFTKYLGYHNTPNNYITPNVNYINCIMDVLKKEWQTPKWKTYWLYIYFHHIVRYSKYRIVYWEFIRKYLQGDQLLTPSEKGYIFGLSAGYNRLITQLYVNKYPRIDEIEYVKTLANDLKLILMRNITTNKWLEPSTKKQALLKLKYLKFIIGAPKITTEDPNLEYDSDNIWKNLVKLSSYRVSLFVKLTGNSTTINIPTIDWKEQDLTGSQAYIVNAFYTANRNEIFIPQAILQKPFIDLQERGIEYNLAFIGFTLSHEMSHSLDKTGSQYDYKGNLKNWWKEKDKKIFKEKTQNIIKQYEEFALRDGLKIDATLSVGENLADIVGCSMITEYLRDFQELHHSSIYIRILSYKALFAYFAIQGRQIIYKEAIKANIETNPHPLEKYRVNCVLARLTTFHSIYKIKKGDKMFWSDENFW